MNFSKFQILTLKHLIFKMNLITYLKHKFIHLRINIFNTNYKKNVLISYIVEPFIYSSNNLQHHTNLSEVIIICKVFKEMGYNVDIINHNYKRVHRINFQKYDVVFGIGYVFEKSCELVKSPTVKLIYYGTGSSFVYQNFAELKRIHQLKINKNLELLPRRLVKTPLFYALSNSHGIILIGNKVTESTYRPYFSGPIFRINVSTNAPRYTENQLKRSPNAKYNFVFFGSNGHILKGLDLCLEFFSKHPKLNLHIFGRRESDFDKAFMHYYKLPNIFWHGFMKIDSNSLYEILKSCYFTILPTSSEGSSTALLNTMAFGCIPIATPMAGIDLEDKGFILERPNIESIEDVVLKELILLTNNELERLSDNSRTYVYNNHTTANFANGLKKSITALL